MTTEPTPQSDAAFIDQFWDYLHGNLPADQAQAFAQTLRDHPELAAQGLEFVELMVQARQAFENEDAVRQALFLPSDADVLTELVQMEATAQAEVVDLAAQQKREQQQHDTEQDPGSLSGHDFAAAASYLLRHALLSRPAILAYAAAVILLAAIVLNPWSGNDSTDAPLADHTPNKPAASTESTPRGSAVATLTATHNAVWASPQAEGASAPGSLTPGSKLHPNQRLTLTAGFAEITTHRGAIAILQAPATIEFTDHDNALQLHTGKLVGICETESSKGFLVHTPHMDITDLGTEFGVSVERGQGCEVYVFDGSVRLEQGRDAMPFDPVVARAGNAVLVRGNGVPEPIASRPNSYYRAIPDDYERLIRNAKPSYYWRFDELTDRGWLADLGLANTMLTGLTRADLASDTAPVGGDSRSLWLREAQEQEKQRSIQSEKPLDLDFSLGLTVEAWVWVPSETDSIMRLISNSETSPDGRPVKGFGLGVSGLPGDRHTDGLVLVFTGYGSFDAFSSQPVPIEEWTHVAATFQDGVVQLSINGEPVAHRIRRDTRLPPGGDDLSVLPSAAAMHVGSSFNEANWVGGIDELAIYNRVLSLKDIASHAQLKSLPPPLADR